MRLLVAALVMLALEGLVMSTPAEAPLPTLGDLWKDGLDGYLSPDPVLLRPSIAGMGPGLDRLLGGGLSPGQTMALVSHGAGAGKTAWLHQLVDGVADASARSLADRGSVTPAIMVSEMTIRDLTIRSLARRAGVEGYVLRDPRGPAGSRPLTSTETVGEAALMAARRAALECKEAAEHVTAIDRRTRVTISDLHECVRRVRASWEAVGANVETVVVAVDPIHRLLDPTRPEIEGLGEALTGLLDLAQAEAAIVMLTSDTTRAAASVRGSLGSLGRDELAAAVEMAFRGSYQLLHLPDVALGLVTMRADDEHLAAEDAARLEQEPEGTLYAEIASAKSRWHDRGQRAAYWLDPAMFRFRPTTGREMPQDVALEDRILEHVAEHPRCSEMSVRRGVKGRDTDIRTAVQKLLRTGQLLDTGDQRTGRKLERPGTPQGTAPEQGREQGWEQVETQEAVPGGSPLQGESPPLGTGSTPGPRAAIDDGGWWKEEAR